MKLKMCLVVRFLAQNRREELFRAYLLLELERLLTTHYKKELWNKQLKISYIAVKSVKWWPDYRSVPAPESPRTDVSQHDTNLKRIRILSLPVIVVEVGDGMVVAV